MNKYSTLGLLLHIRKDKLNKKGEAPIFLRVTVNGKRAEISTKQFVLPEKWNNQASQIKGTKEEVRVLNQFLHTLRNKANRIYQKLIDEGKPISSGHIIRLTLRYSNK
jgi:Arm domain-containing DNA-binding protein